MSKKRINIIFAIMAIILILTIVLIIGQNLQNPPKSVSKLAEAYFSNILEGEYDASLSLTYIKEENKGWINPILRAMREDKLSEYQILGYTKMNKNLYEVTCRIITSELGEQVSQNYIMRIDNSWKYVINRRDIPTSIYEFSEPDDQPEIVWIVPD